MGLLNGGGAALFGELFAGTYLPATIAGTDSETMVAGKLQRVAAVPRECRVQVDSATERMRSAEGFTEMDRAIYVLSASLEGDIDTGAEITVLDGAYAGVAFRVASVDRDPVAAYWLCRGTMKNG